MRRIVLCAFLCLAATTPSRSQFSLSVLDCSPCGTVLGGISSAHSASVSAINTNTTVQMQAAATKIVFAITQSTAQISGAIDKNTAVLKSIADARIAAHYQQSNAERAAQLRYDHAAGPQSCRSPSMGRAIQTTTQGNAAVSSELNKRNRDWNRVATRDGSSRSSSAKELRAKKKTIVENDPASADQTFSQVVQPDRLTAKELQLAQLFSQQITNPTPQPEITEDGEGDSAEAWAKREQRVRVVELSQSAFETAIARRTPTTEMPFFGDGNAVQLRSFMEALSAESARRFQDPSWSVALQRMPPAAVLRELTTIQAHSLYLQMEQFKEMERIKLLLAAMLPNSEAGSQ